MRRMKRKDQFIEVIGTWTGEGDDEVTAWLAGNLDYVFQVQTENDEQVGWRTKPRAKQEFGEEDFKPRKQLVILGRDMYDEVNMGVGSVLVMVEGDRLTAYDQEMIDESYENV